LESLTKSTPESIELRQNDEISLPKFPAAGKLWGAIARRSPTEFAWCERPGYRPSAALRGRQGKQ
jgi:hypothetical protein